ncbi:hypothetical protein M2272_003552 [Mycobacterium frederiksbergense]|uniref:Uncharacterized protein n=1 Tax=Mycolicibacterium frederiksbergense TaxID=117567 RepID=A0ABT6L1S6_9MYCO|nr:hypothetical protein [Mycolicibacterium frederiksbergense]MDH6196899.1 hypothetical protein [Mycolicibacterium frederiksbergense]
MPGQGATTFSLDVPPAPAPASDAAARMSLQAPSSGTGESTGAASDGGPAVGTVSDNANRRAGGSLHVDNTAKQLQRKIKEAGDQTQSNLQKVGDNLNKMMKTKPGKHRVGATSGGGSDAGSESGSGSES